MARLDSFLRLVVEQRVSDLHFSAGGRPVIRHDGELLEVPFRVLTAEETRRFLWEMLSDAQRAALERERQLDLMHVVPGVGRFRANLYMQAHGPGAVFRVIPERPPSLDGLGLPSVLRRLTRLGNGLVIVTGPTGSGKSTTLAAMVREINEGSKRHVITVEDPIEFVHEPTQSVITQREVGTHARSFAAALRSALRESPDVLVVGELRDQETVSLALQAAETGVLVLATLHTNSAAKAVDRIIDVVPEDSRDQARGTLSVLLRAVVAQHLCKRASGEGRIAATEVLLQSYAVANLIREDKVHQLEAHLRSAFYDPDTEHSLDACLLHFVQEGLVTAHEALGAADHPELLQRALAAVPEEH